MKYNAILKNRAENKDMYIFLLTCLFKVIATDIVINTNSGSIRGVSSLAEDVEAYLGIPYAEPPVGELRFARPIPKKKWTQVHDASNIPPPCTQISVEPFYFMPDITHMSEDCLYLNIWTPKSEPFDGLRPVIIYLHPGGFISGSTNLKSHDGSHLASIGNVVVVSVNYRLGNFGYFLAYIEEADGNMGMFDQIMAIKWVKDNAKYFNGDPKNIILMGFSAGAYSVSAHMISPLSKNLFRRAIIESGSIVNPLYLDDNARLFKNSQSVASLAGCSNETVTLSTDPHSVVKCLKTKSKEDLVKAEQTILFSGPIIFFPRMNDEFLPKNSIDLFREGKFRKDVDVLIGIAKEEGTMMFITGARDYLGKYGKNAPAISKLRALALSQGLVSFGAQPNASVIVNFYMSSVKKRTTTEYLKMLSNIVGDFAIACNTVFLADLVSAKGNSVYFYRFDFRAASTPLAEWAGTTHLDEVQYVFGIPYHENFTEEESELSHRLIHRWSAFSRTGNPNIPGQVPWLRYNYHNPLYMNFGQEEESIRLKPNDRCEFWRKRFKADVNTDLIRILRNSGLGNEMLFEQKTFLTLLIAFWIIL